jgi:hypothetical protein
LIETAPLPVGATGFMPALRFLMRLSSDDRRALLDPGLVPLVEPGGELRPWYCGPHRLGWVPIERAHAMQAQWPHCHWQADRLIWSAQDWSSEQRSQHLAHWLAAQRDCGQLQGWRGEAYRFWTAPAYPPNPTQEGLFDCERAGFRHLGLRSHAVHVNGFTDEGDLWCGRRSLHKATDPGLLDSLSAGGLTAGEGIWTTLHRELQEEAGLMVAPDQSQQWLGSIDGSRSVPQGWHHETLWIFNLAVAAGQSPVNQDGEVAEFLRLTPQQVVSSVREDQWTLDAVLALQHGLGPVAAVLLGA